MKLRIVYATLALCVVILMNRGVDAEAAPLAAELPREDASTETVQNRKANDSNDIIRDVVSSVRLKSLTFNPDESDAYYKVLGLAASQDVAQQHVDAEEFMRKRWQSGRYQSRDFEQFPAFEDLFLHPADYQGEPVTLTGHIRRLIYYSADDNPYGVNMLYEAWLFTDDSQSNPAVVILTEIPQGFPQGDAILEQATVTGYFFRMHGYQARDSKRLAPMILGKTLRWNQPVKSEPVLWPWMVGLLVLFGALILLFVITARSDRSHRRRLHQRLSSTGDAASDAGPIFPVDAADILDESSEVG